MDRETPPFFLAIFTYIPHLTTRNTYSTGTPLKKFRSASAVRVTSWERLRRTIYRIRPVELRFNLRGFCVKERNASIADEILLAFVLGGGGLLYTVALILILPARWVLEQSRSRGDAAKTGCLERSRDAR